MMEYQQTGGEKVSEVVLRALAAEENTEPKDIQPVLHESIAPEALDDLFATCSSDDNGTVQFEHAGYWITVNSDGRVQLESGENNENT